MNVTRTLKLKFLALNIAKADLFEASSYLQGDFNAGRNLAIWDDRSCPINFEKAVSVMGTDNLSDGVFGTPPNLMKGALKNSW